MEVHCAGHFPKYDVTGNKNVLKTTVIKVSNFSRANKPENLRTLLVLPIHKYATVFPVVINYFP
jgi:hypothetical protein